ncbi:MAG: DUF4268 domain-containing protein [Planctomycetaceae bacterium]|nr:DUF4268 domain-containing protein [Planctomycetaceae bacterium]
MTTNTNSLGRLERVDLRNVWETEAGDFTPWLAREDNIALLSDTIGIDLEVEAQEKNVGPFRADILCKDTANDHWVLIENQLERTDHSHLGQLITYAAGLNAVTIVWIAHRFTEEHRAALDWLNEMTGEDITFFGLEVELWRIGESPVAPKFNVISSPNDWTKSISGAARKITEGDLSETRIQQREFWRMLQDSLDEISGPVRAVKPQPQSWLTYSLGRTNCYLVSAINTRDQWIAVSTVTNGKHAKPFFHLLQEQKAEIETELGEALDWRELLDKKESQIVLRRENIDPLDQNRWPELCEWFSTTLTKFHEVFSHRVKQLDPEDYLPPGEDQ